MSEFEKDFEMVKSIILKNHPDGHFKMIESITHEQHGMKIQMPQWLHEAADALKSMYGEEKSQEKLEKISRQIMESHSTKNMWNCQLN